MKKSVLLGSLVVAVLLSAAAYATADSQIHPGAGSPNKASGNVDVKATVNPKVAMTIATPGSTSQTVDFGSVDPGATVPSQIVTLTVDSNKDFTVSGTISGTAPTEIGLNHTLAAASSGKGQALPFYDTLSLAVPWTTTPAAYTATVLYTVTQN